MKLRRNCAKHFKSAARDCYQLWDYNLRTFHSTKLHRRVPMLLNCKIMLMGRSDETADVVVQLCNVCEPECVSVLDFDKQVASRCFCLHRQERDQCLIRFQPYFLISICKRRIQFSVNDDDVVENKQIERLIITKFQDDMDALAVLVRFE